MTFKANESLWISAKAKGFFKVPKSSKVQNRAKVRPWSPNPKEGAKGLMAPQFRWQVVRLTVEETRGY